MVQIEEGLLESVVVANTSGQDLKGAVLAEHVVVRRDPRRGVSVTFDFLCSNCGRRHFATEYDDNPIVSVVGWALPCGWVSVRMPWAKTPARDEQSIYGCKTQKEQR